MKTVTEHFSANHGSFKRAQVPLGCSTKVDVSSAGESPTQGWTTKKGKVALPALVTTANTAKQPQKNSDGHFKTITKRESDNKWCKI